MSSIYDLFGCIDEWREPTVEQALALADCGGMPALLRAAAAVRDAGHDGVISYSKKVFIPLTKLCRDCCHYCTFAQPPQGTAAYLLPEQVLAIARAGAQAGCREALFTLGDKPELRYRVARNALARLGHATTLDYLAAMAAMVFKETGLLPHLNPGVMEEDEIRRLRAVSASQGIMLESTSERLAAKGGPHYGSPDKLPAVRLATIAAAGEAAVPFTSGILIGIGETRRERIQSLLALRDLHRRYGHIQEIIIQNFRAKPMTRMADAHEPDFADHLWTIAVARILFGPRMNIQAPPNLSCGPLTALIAAGINDWGGVSPVTIDHVNPEAPWPEIKLLEQRTAQAGKLLVERLAVYPEYATNAGRWLDPQLHAGVLRASDSEGYARADDWVPGSGRPTPLSWSGRKSGCFAPDRLKGILDRASNGDALPEADLASLFSARGNDFHRVCKAADDLRARMCGEEVSYVVNRNINYTNICYFRCKFCAFSKGKLALNLRGKPYNLGLEEIQRRSIEAWERGATEVCLQGGIHPDYTGATYLEICRAIRKATPGLHIHAFSPLEIWQGAATLGTPVVTFLEQLKGAGLGTLPGTAAEILDDDVRAIICPDKVTTRQWIEVIEAAHSIGLRTTSTIMFGHIDGPQPWARHLLELRRLQERTGGITEFVPLPFVPMETPIYLQGRARSGPTFREAVLMHAVARLALHPHIVNIQASWVKLGPEGLKWCLRSGANDIGGTLMNESISRAAGATHGEEMPPEQMEKLIRSIGRRPRQRTTLYGDPPDTQRRASFEAGPLQAMSVWT
ncbi:MAG TPA: 5-amino-6-(D-ribitylamino)uracil--L-tyrosine 4-hydroxyphenyl transferase CofH [Xanthobacteraceae bacterium]|jgi:FO synthase